MGFAVVMNWTTLAWCPHKDHLFGGIGQRTVNELALSQERAALLTKL